ncbi:MAG: xanthine dehydrogenase accessory protein XdhC [Kordiimonas sp.]
MQSWVNAARKILTAEGCLILVTVVSTKGSAPRGAGTKMLVSSKALIGTIGGGNLEFQVVEQARKLLISSELQFIVQHYALGPLLEQCCGGNVEILLERLEASNSGFLGEAPKAYLKTSFVGGAVQKEWSDKYQRQAVVLWDKNGERLDVAKDAVLITEEVARQPRPIYMFGAGHVGRAVANALAPLPFDVTWIDSRADEFPIAMPENASAQVDDDYLKYVEAAPEGALYLIFTHSHQLDYDVTAKILRRGDASYCGMIGSMTKRARFENRMLREHVLRQQDLPKFICPIGLPEIEGKEPAVIAASVAAQLLQYINGDS